VPLVRVPGNHDVGNALMRDVWRERHGALHHHFRYRDVLFLVLDTQDPPQSLAQMLRPGNGAALPPALMRLLGGADRDEQELIDEMHRLLTREPATMTALMKAIKDGTQPGNVSDEQVDQLVAAVADHSDVGRCF
jgi:hypothetical protein